MDNPVRSQNKLISSLVILLCAGLFTGCATTRVTYKTHANAAQHIPKLHVVVIAPPDAELSELSAGGVTELRDDWTREAARNISEALGSATGWHASAALTSEQTTELRAEQQDVQALLRAITLNHIMGQFPGPNQLPAQKDNQLTYNTGPLTHHAKLLGDDAVLFVFMRNSYATAGRKALAVLGVLSAGFTGVAIIPSMGVDVSSAALVENDGTVLWFNQILGGGDPRTPEGARELVKHLLDGLPSGAPAHSRQISAL